MGPSPKNKKHSKQSGSQYSVNPLGSYINVLDPSVRGIHIG